jgi:hypothetical protein
MGRCLQLAVLSRAPFEHQSAKRCPADPHSPLYPHNCILSEESCNSIAPRLSSLPMCKQTLQRWARHNPNQSVPGPLKPRVPLLRPSAIIPPLPLSPPWSAVHSAFVSCSPTSRVCRVWTCRIWSCLILAQPGVELPSGARADSLLIRVVKDCRFERGPLAVREPTLPSLGPLFP